MNSGADAGRLDQSETGAFASSSRASPLFEDIEAIQTLTFQG